MRLRLFKSRYERFVLALALIAVGASSIWYWRARLEVRRVRALPVAIHLAASEYQPASPAVYPRTAAVWQKPVPQSAGADWLYELFTPPVVFYHRPSASFTVLPSVDSTPSGAPFDLELIGVKRAPYRIQLVGYTGSLNAYTAIFSDSNSPGILRAKPGDKIGNGGLTLKSFSVRRVALEHRDQWPVYEVAAFAELLDEATGEAVVLDTRTPKLTAEILAAVKLTSLSGVRSLKDVRAGEVFSDARYHYRIERVQLAPAEVVVQRLQRDAPIAETTTLRISGADAVQAEKRDRTLSDFSSRPATGLVTTEN